MKNLYFYHCANETFKILKYRKPISLYSLYTFSSLTQKNICLVTPEPSNAFIYRSSIIWNYIRKKIKIHDAATPITFFKSQIKSFILSKQSLGDAENWIEYNFLAV